MKYLKVTIENFKPYLDKNEIILYTQGATKDNPVTANVGPTGHGKTSICEAILWAIYGTEEKPNWTTWVNNIAKKIYKTKQMKVPVSVKLELELDGKIFQILRTAEYDAEQDSAGIDKVDVIESGSPMSEDESVKWIENNFPPHQVIRYYIFSAEDMLVDFKERGNAAVRDHVNVITGLTALSKAIEVLGSNIQRYNSDIEHIRASDKGFNKTEYLTKTTDISLKEKAITDEQNDIKDLEEEKKKLFSQSPTQKEQEIFKNFHADDQLTQEKKTLEESFLSGSFIGKVDHIFLSEIITSCITKLQNQPFSKADFDTSANIIKSVLGGKKYCGIMIEGNKVELVDNTVYPSLSKNVLKDVGELSLTAGTAASTRSGDLTLFGSHDVQSTAQIESIIDKHIVPFLEKQDEQRQIRQKNHQLGGNDKTLVAKIESFNGFVEEITTRNSRIVILQNQIIELGKAKIELEKKQTYSKDKQNDILQHEEIIKKITAMQEDFENAHTALSRELIQSVTEQASKTFIGIMKDGKTRYKGINITDDYDLQILDIDGNSLHVPDQISSGTLELALFCFLLSLPSYVQTHIPLFIDNPFMRLDAGHESRLLKQLVSFGSQIIMNLIPGREYMPNNFKLWLNQCINTQNWIDRKDDTQYHTNSYVHTVKNYDPNKVIDYDVELM